jgi:hypothetical protein
MADFSKIFMTFRQLLSQGFCSSPELKAQVSFSYCPLSVCMQSFTFSTSSPEALAGPVLTRLGTDHPWGWDSSFFCFFFK